MIDEYVFRFTNDHKDISDAVNVFVQTTTSSLGYAPTDEMIDFVNNRFHDDRNNLLVCCPLNKENNILAIAAGGQAYENKLPVDGRFHISHLFVLPDYQNVGIGSIMMSIMLSKAKKLGFKSAQLWVHSNNNRAISVYNKSGFVNSGRTQIHYDGGEISLFIKDKI